MTYTEENIEQGRWLFAGECEFKVGATKISQIPDMPDINEIAFCGLSNVGKSSLINALTERKTLVRVSGNPGCTRQINFFLLRKDLMLVDLPGYGYAKVSKSSRADWGKLITSYLKGRPQLKRVCLLIDSRRGLKETDNKIMDLLDEVAVIYQIILTKVDKSKKNDVEKIISDIKINAHKHTALHPEIIQTSSRDNVGLDILRAQLSNFISKN